MAVNIDPLEQDRPALDPGDLAATLVGGSPEPVPVRTTVLSDNKPTDALTMKCGFRTIRFDVQKGFFLNDQPLKVQGMCCHQDHAGVGIAVPDALWEFRLRKLKEMGANASAPPTILQPRSSSMPAILWGCWSWMRTGTSTPRRSTCANWSGWSPRPQSSLRDFVVALQRRTVAGQRGRL